MIFCLPVKALASLSTPMHASVPEFTNLTISILGTAAITISASVFSRRQGAPKLVPFFMVSANAASTCSSVNQEAELIETILIHLSDIKLLQISINLVIPHHLRDQ